MHIHLKALEIRNFKGIKEKSITFEKITSILGANETGKTTIFDSFTWLLFGKDSQNKTDFEIKPLDKDNNVLHGLETSVKGIFLVNGQELLLQRILKEKWTTPRGQAEAIFSGNETSYFIDEVPAKMKDYKEKINSLVQEETFRLISDPSVFNTILGWKERRNIIFEMCGDVSDQEVIDSNKKLKELQGVIGDRSLEDEKARIQSIKKNLKKEKEQIAPRIDEVHRGLPNISNLDFKALKEERTREKEKLNDFGKVMDRQFEIGAKIAEIDKKIRETERKRDEECEQKKLELTRGKDKEISNLEDSIHNFEIAIPKTENLIEQSKNNIQTLKKDRENLLTKHHQIKEKINEIINKEFFIDLDTICPTCKQILPANDIKTKEEEYKASFEKEKEINLTKLNAELEQILSSGSAIKEEISKEEKSVELLNTSLKQLKTDKADFLENLELLKKEKEEILKETVIEIPVDKIIELEKEKLEIKKELETLSVGNRVEIELKVSLLDKQLNQEEQHKDGLARIDQLQKEERELAQKLANLEKTEYLMEEFTRAKVSMLEDKINKVFSFVSFKMFKEQINGGLEETCLTLVKGVPYENVNTAGRIQAGIDIINALNKFYGVTVPIFIDNRESVTEIPDTESQIINLIVSPENKELKIQGGIK